MRHFLGYLRFWYEKKVFIYLHPANLVLLTYKLVTIEWPWYPPLLFILSISYTSASKMNLQDQKLGLLFELALFCRAFDFINFLDGNPSTACLSSSRGTWYKWQQTKQPGHHPDEKGDITRRCLLPHSFIHTTKAEVIWRHSLQRRRTDVKLQIKKTVIWQITSLFQAVHWATSLNSVWTQLNWACRLFFLSLHYEEKERIKEVI